MRGPCARRPRAIAATGAACVFLVFVAADSSLPAAAPPYEAPAAPSPLGSTGEALGRAASCLAGTIEGDGFRDPYLAYVYPDEKLPLPEETRGLTYRLIDADTVLVLLERTGRAPRILEPAIERADRSLRSLPPVWRRKGIYNLRRAAAEGGVALDTFCFVGWLYQDGEMAGVAAAGLDGDGWIPESLYEGNERFRRDADEDWCLRLLASRAGPGIGAATGVLDRIAATFRREVAADPASDAAFYEAYHLAMVLAEVRRAGIALPERFRNLPGEIVAAFDAWTGAHSSDPKTETADLIEWANLATVDRIDVSEGTRGAGGDAAAPLRARALDVLLRHQSDDGCFRIPGASPPGMGTSFLTLRALLALALAPR